MTIREKLGKKTKKELLMICNRLKYPIRSNANKTEICVVLDNMFKSRKHWQIISNE